MSTAALTSRSHVIPVTAATARAYGCWCQTTAANILLGRGAPGARHAPRVSRVADPATRAPTSAPSGHSDDPHAVRFLSYESAGQPAVMVRPQLHPELWSRPLSQSAPRPAPAKQRLHVTLLVLVLAERSAPPAFVAYIESEGTLGHQISDMLSLLMFSHDYL